MLRLGSHKHQDGNRISLWNTVMRKTDIHNIQEIKTNCDKRLPETLEK
jgi:hypothetical protein